MKNNLLSDISFEDVIAPIEVDTDKTTPSANPDEIVEDKDKVQDDVVIPDKDQDEPEPTEPDPDPLDKPEPKFYEALQKILGYEIDGEYEESVEGVAEYTKAVAEKIAQEEVDTLFEAIPDVKEYLTFRLNGGEPSKFFESRYSEPDYTQYKLSEDDETTQEIIVRRYLSSQNYNDTEITETIKDYKETGLLYKTANRVLDKLVSSQKSKKEKLLYEQEQKALENKEKREKTVEAINKVIEKGQLQSLVIPEKERREFKAWLLNPISKSGKTKRQEVMEGLSMEQKLELEYLAFKGFNLSDLVQKEATRTKIGFLKKSSKEGRLSGTGTSASTKPNDISKLKISDFI